MISFKKILICTAFVCLFTLNCNAAIFQQITLQGEYLTQNGEHPGIPYNATASDWTVWQDIEEVEGEDFMGNPVVRTTCSLLLNTGQETVLLDSYSQSSWPGIPGIFGGGSFTNIILDGQRVSWEHNYQSHFETILKVYSNGITETYSFGMSSSYPYDYSFGPDYFAIFKREFNVEPFSDLEFLFTDTMEWQRESITLNQVFPENDASTWLGFGGFSMQVYDNGIELLHPRLYTGVGDDTWYTEHFWMEIPEPLSVYMLSLGSLGVLHRRRRVQI